MNMVKLALFIAFLLVSVEALPQNTGSASGWLFSSQNNGQAGHIENQYGSGSHANLGTQSKQTNFWN